MLFDSWGDIFRTLIVGILAYVALIVVLRVSGKRTLSKMNAYDLIVTVALGSTLATILLSTEVALAEGLMAFVTLIGLQFAVAWLSVRSKTVRDLVKSTPQLLFYRGAFMDREMRRERVTRDEVYAAIRAHGSADLDSVEAVVIETDGSFTVLERAQSVRQTALHGVAGEHVRRSSAGRPR